MKVFLKIYFKPGALVMLVANSISSFHQKSLVIYEQQLQKESTFVSQADWTGGRPRAALKEHGKQKINESSFLWVSGE